ncbi:hypothetical protein ebB135 [Aromatoleum aromaticum EbN1]|uniref:Uncharacterized protein n=1 Tax=Aromatoleum aromaticum (strain DSM 19018 / LMG 30748 / EbN1) TaxID=76114 RepID=Q5P302_AROAE|nr:hypothetical protein ebB135 [Aromatoleum aromaticum EbN1]
MLDDDHRVAEVAKLAQRAEQPVIVTLVQADRRLVEHVHDARQARTDLAREADALGFAPRQRIGRAIERQVVEPDVDQEAQAVRDFLDDLAGDEPAVAAQRKLVEKAFAVAERHPAHGMDRLTADQHVAGFGAQSRAHAAGARVRCAVLGEFLAHCCRIGFAIAPLEVRDDPFERMFLGDRTPVVGEIAEGDFAPPGTVQHDFAHFFGQLAERCIDVETVMRRKAREHLEVELVAPVPAADRAGRQRQIGMHDDAGRIEEIDLAQTVALRARAGGIVERKQAGFEFGERVAADRAREACGKQVLDAAVDLDCDRATVGMGQRRLEGFGDAPALVAAHLEPVDDHLDRVPPAFLERGQGVEFADRAIDAHAHEALRA